MCVRLCSLVILAMLLSSLVSRCVYLQEESILQHIDQGTFLSIVLARHSLRNLSRLIDQKVRMTFVAFTESKLYDFLQSFFLEAILLLDSLDDS